MTRTSSIDGGSDVGARSEAAGVIVLGTGRSGTSAIASAFVAAGFFAGREDEVLGPHPSNPAGHYEPLPVLEINEELLKERFGCRWWADAPPAEEQLAHRAEVEPRLAAVLNTLIAAAEGAPVAIKEPRINGLLPLWQPVFDGVLHPVLAVRDPLEIALSHAHRDGTSVSHALAAWEVQTSLVLQSLEARMVTVAPYAQLTARPELAVELVSEAAAHLDPERVLRVDPGKAGAALRPNLRNQTGAELDHDDYLTGRQRALWRYLSSLPLGDVRVELPAPLRQLNTAAQVTMRSESERVRLGEAHALVLAELCQAREREASFERRIAEAAAAEKRHTQEIAEIKSSRSWRLTAPLRRAKRVLRVVRRPDAEPVPPSAPQPAASLFDPAVAARGPGTPSS